LIAIVAGLTCCLFKKTKQQRFQTLNWVIWNQNRLLTKNQLKMK